MLVIACAKTHRMLMTLEKHTQIHAHNPKRGFPVESGLTWRFSSVPRRTRPAMVPRRMRPECRERSQQNGVRGSLHTSSVSQASKPDLRGLTRAQMQHRPWPPALPLLAHRERARGQGGDFWGLGPSCESARKGQEFTVGGGLPEKCLSHGGGQ